MDEQLKSYRNHLVLAEQKAQEDYDKTVLSLSGGALGVTFAFLKDLVGSNPISYKGFLFWAWICWAFSIAATLCSYHASHKALRKTIYQVDKGAIYDEIPGGKSSSFTSFLNRVSGALFVIGVILISIFVWINLEVINVRPK
jgi:hypothetical protein